LSRSHEQNTLIQLLKTQNNKIRIKPGSQGGQVGYSLDFHPGGLGSTPAQSNQQKKKIKKKFFKKLKPPSVP